MTSYTTKTDAIAYAIEPALDNAEDFDMDAIFDACFTYDETEHGFVQTADEDEFWAVAAKCAK